MLGSLTLKIPWTNLKTQPLHVQVDRVLLVARPLPDLRYDADQVRAKAQEEKEKELEKLNKDAKSRKKAKTADTIEKSKSNAFLVKLVARLVANLQLQVSNIHIRYEDPLSGTAAGVTLANLSLVSTTSSWVPQLAKTFGDQIFKLASIERLSVYWNASAAMIGDLPPAEFARLALILAQNDAPTVSNLCHPLTGASLTPDPLLAPLSLTVRLAVGTTLSATPGTPKIDLKIQSEPLCVDLSDAQYQDLLHTGISLIHARRRYACRQFRPPPEQTPATAPRAWWKYAQNAVLAPIKERNAAWTWDAFRARRDNREAYVRAYIDVETGSGSTKKNAKLTLKALELALDLGDIKFYRFRAERQMRKQKIKSKVKETKEVKETKKKKEEAAAPTVTSSATSNVAATTSDEAEPKKASKPEWMQKFSSVFKKKESKETPRAATAAPVAIVSSSATASKDAQPHHVAHVAEISAPEGHLPSLAPPQPQTAPAAGDDEMAELYDILGYDQETDAVSVGFYPADYAWLCTSITCQGLMVSLKGADVGAFAVANFSGFSLNLARRSATTSLDMVLRSLTVSHTNGVLVEWLGGASDPSSAPAPPFLSMNFEQPPSLPLDSERLTLRSQAVRVTYSKSLIDRLISFARPRLDKSSMVLLEQIIRHSIDVVVDLTRASLEYQLNRYQAMELDIDVAGPVLLLPDVETGPTRAVIGVGIGALRLKSHPRLKDVRSTLEAIRGRAIEANELDSLRSLLMERVGVRLERLQMVVTDTIPAAEECLRAADGGPSRFHVIETINADVLLERCVAPNAAGLPVLRISGELPPLSITLLGPTIVQAAIVAEALVDSFMVAPPPVEERVAHRAARAAPTAAALPRAAGADVVDDFLLSGRNVDFVDELMTSASIMTVSSASTAVAMPSVTIAHRVLAEVSIALPDIRVRIGDGVAVARAKGIRLDVSARQFDTNLSAVVGSLDLVDRHDTMMVMLSPGDEDATAALTAIVDSKSIFSHELEAEGAVLDRVGISVGRFLVQLTADQVLMLLEFSADLLDHDMFASLAGRVPMDLLSDLVAPSLPPHVTKLALNAKVGDVIARYYVDGTSALAIETSDISADVEQTAARTGVRAVVPAVSIAFERAGLKMPPLIGTVSSQDPLLSLDLELFTEVPARRVEDGAIKARVGALFANIDDAMLFNIAAAGVLLARRTRDLFVRLSDSAVVRISNARPPSPPSPPPLFLFDIHLTAPNIFLPPVSGDSAFMAESAGVALGVSLGVIHLTSAVTEGGLEDSHVTDRVTVSISDVGVSLVPAGSGRETLLEPVPLLAPLGLDVVLERRLVNPRAGALAVQAASDGVGALVETAALTAKMGVVDMALHERDVYALLRTVLEWSVWGERIGALAAVEGPKQKLHKHEKESSPKRADEKLALPPGLSSVALNVELAGVRATLVRDAGAFSTTAGETGDEALAEAVLKPITFGAVVEQLRATAELRLEGIEVRDARKQCDFVGRRGVPTAVPLLFSTQGATTASLSVRLGEARRYASPPSTTSSKESGLATPTPSDMSVERRRQAEAVDTLTVVVSQLSAYVVLDFFAALTVYLKGGVRALSHRPSKALPPAAVQAVADAARAAKDAAAAQPSTAKAVTLPMLRQMLSGFRVEASVQLDRCDLVVVKDPTSARSEIALLSLPEGTASLIITENAHASVSVSLLRFFVGTGRLDARDDIRASLLAPFGILASASVTVADDAVRVGGDIGLDSIDVSLSYSDARLLYGVALNAKRVIAAARPFWRTERMSDEEARIADLNVFLATSLDAEQRIALELAAAAVASGKAAAEHEESGAKSRGAAVARPMDVLMDALVGSLQVQLMGITANVTNDRGTVAVPVMQAQLPATKCQAQLEGPQVSLYMDMRLSASVFNERLTAWEPLIEPYKFSASVEVASESFPPQVSVQVDAERTLELSVTQSMISNIATTVTMWTTDFAAIERAGADPEMLKRRIFSPYNIINQTGERLEVCRTDAQGGWSDASAVAVDVGGEQPWSFGDDSVLRKRAAETTLAAAAATGKVNLVETPSSHRISVRFAEVGATLSNISVDREGSTTYVLPLRGQRAMQTQGAEDATLRVRVVVKWFRGQRRVHIQSTFVLHNSTFVDIEMRVTDPSRDALPTYITIKAGDEGCVPLGASLNGHIALRPVGSDYQWSDSPISWRSFASKDLMLSRCSANSSDASTAFLALLYKPPVKLQFKPTAEERQLHGPTLTVDILPPMEIENLLPYTAHFSVLSMVDGDLQPLVALTVPSGGMGTVLAANLALELHLLATVESTGGTMYRANSPARIHRSRDQSGLATGLVMTRGADASNSASTVELAIEYDTRGNELGIKRVVIYAPYLFVNRTGLPLKYKQVRVVARDGPETSDAAAGGMSVSTLDLATTVRDAEPLMMSFEKRRGIKLRCAVRSENTKWSPTFMLEAAGTSGELLLAGDKVQGKGADAAEFVRGTCQVGLVIRNAPQKFSRTTVVSLMPRYVVKNAGPLVVRFAECLPNGTVSTCIAHFCHFC